MSDIYEKIAGWTRWYALHPKTGEVVACKSLAEYAELMGDPGAERRRIIARTEIGRLVVSTVFLPIDHAFRPGGKPILFESMIFTNEEFGDGNDLNFDWYHPVDHAQRRYRTIPEALAGHATLERFAIRWVKRRYKFLPKIRRDTDWPQESRKE